MITSITKLADCMNELPHLPDDLVYLAYCDTQYGILEDGRRSESRGRKVKQKNGSSTLVPSRHIAAGWDNEVMDKDYWNLIRQKSKVQAVFGVNYIVGNIPYVKLDWGRKPPRREQFNEFIEANPSGYIIWDKVNGKSDFSDCELIWTNLNQPTKAIQFMWAGMMQGKDIINGYTQEGDKSLNQKRIHPTEKPIKFNDYLLQQLGCVSGCMVLDSHSGGQSLRISCHKQGLNYVGYETHEPYFSAGNKRYDYFKMQQELPYFR